MTLKQATHSIHSQLKTFNKDLKRSHCRELLAAFFDYNTMSALEQNGFFHNAPRKLFETYSSKWEYEFDEISSESTLFNERCSKIAPSISPEIISTLTREVLTTTPLFFITFDELIYEVEDINRSPSFNGNSYWYEQLLAGKNLSTSQLTFANEYRAHQQSQKEIQKFINLAIKKGHKQAPITSCMLDIDADSTIIRLKNLASNGNKQAVIELYRSFSQEDYIVDAAKYGSFEALENLARSFTENYSFNPQDNAFSAHYYNELARLYGFDLSKSNTHAVGDPEYGWSIDNSDYYGPLYLDGYEGLNLPFIELEQKEKACKKAVSDFNNINS